MTGNWILGLLLLALLASGCVSPSRQLMANRTAATKAVNFLVREVPAWRRDNGCFSCHNNGDAARAVLAAKQLGFHVPTSSLADTMGWVTRPTGWDHNQGDPGVSDKVLADVQFATTLAAAMEAGQVTDGQPMREAVARLRADQDATGAWPIQAKDAIGSPATHGTPLATHLTLRFLRHAGTPEADDAIRKGVGWLRDHQPKDIPAAVAVVLEFARSTEPAAQARRELAVAFILKAQAPDGGWGPYASSRTEAFDTAIAMLALLELPSTPEFAERIQRGRKFLLALQQADGSWPATTRPAGGVSYAQQLSTTGWATLALLAMER